MCDIIVDCINHCALAILHVHISTAYLCVLLRPSGTADHPQLLATPAAEDDRAKRSPPSVQKRTQTPCKLDKGSGARVGVCTCNRRRCGFVRNDQWLIGVFFLPLHFRYTNTHKQVNISYFRRGTPTIFFHSPSFLPWACISFLKITPWIRNQFGMSSLMKQPTVSIKKKSAIKNETAPQTNKQAQNLSPLTHGSEHPRVPMIPQNDRSILLHGQRSRDRSNNVPDRPHVLLVLHSKPHHHARARPDGIRKRQPPLKPFRSRLAPQGSQQRLGIPVGYRHDRYRRHQLFRRKSADLFDRSVGGRAGGVSGAERVEDDGPALHARSGPPAALREGRAFREPVLLGVAVDYHAHRSAVLRVHGFQPTEALAWWW